MLGKKNYQLLYNQNTEEKGNGLFRCFLPVSHPKSPSCVELTCGVPNLSIRGTRCKGAYFASSLFILTSSRSPSV